MSKLAIKQLVTATLNAIYNKVARFYDISVPATLTVSNIQQSSVSEWKDRSFNQQAATNGDAGSQPTYDNVNKTLVMGGGKFLKFPIPPNFNGWIFTATKEEGILKLRLNLTILNSNDKAWVEANGLTYGGYEGSPVVGVVFYNESDIPSVDETLIINYLKSVCGNAGVWPANNTNVGNRFRGDQPSSYLFQYLASVPNQPDQNNATLNLKNRTVVHALFYYMRFIKSIPSDLDISSVTDLSYFTGETYSLESFPPLNTGLVTNFEGTWHSCISLTSFPLINTAAGNNFNYTWYNCYSLYHNTTWMGDVNGKLSFAEATQMYFTWAYCRFNTFQDYSSGTDYTNNFGKVTVFWDTWSHNTNLNNFKEINTVSAQTMHAVWYNCTSLANIEPLDTRNCTRFTITWANCALTEESVDNALISIAAGLANNRTKSLTATDTLTGGTNKPPGNTNRRATSNLWEAWEQANTTGNNISLRYVNDTALGYNFSNGITGLQAKNWMLAKFGIDIPTPNTTLSDGNASSIIVSAFTLDNLNNLSGTTAGDLTISQDSIAQGATSIWLYSTRTASYNLPLGFRPTFTKAGNNPVTVQIANSTTMNAATVFTVSAINIPGNTITLARTSGTGNIPANSRIYFGSSAATISPSKWLNTTQAITINPTIGGTTLITLSANITVSPEPPAANDIGYLPQLITIQPTLSATSNITLNQNNAPISSTISQWIPSLGSGITAIQNTSASQPTLTTSNTGSYAVLFNGRIFRFTFSSAFNNGKVYIGTISNSVLEFNLANMAAGSFFDFGRGENVAITGIIFINTQNPNSAQDTAIKAYLTQRGSNPTESNSTLSEFATRSSLSGRFDSENFGGGSTTDFYFYIASFPLINTQNTTNMFFAWATAVYFNYNLKTFPLINTQKVTGSSGFYGTWTGCRGLTTFPFINTESATHFTGTWMHCSGLSSFPQINTINVSYFGGTWQDCNSLASFPPINTIRGTNFNLLFNLTALTSLSVDNALISIAAGLSNNPNKNEVRVFQNDPLNDQTFGSVTNPPTNINRRVDSNPTTGNQVWELWETTNNSESGIANTPLTKIALKNRNDTFRTGTANAVTYNFSNGISGQQARLWMIAFASNNSKPQTWNFSTAAPGTPTLPTNSRVYRSNSGVTSNNWTPVSGTNNQSLIGSPTTQPLHGLTNVLLGDGKGIEFNSLATGSNTYTVYIGLARGYYKFTANGVGTTARWGTELAAGTGVLSIVLFFGIPTTQESTIINWLNYYGSYNDLTVSDPYTDPDAQKIRQTSFT